MRRGDPPTLSWCEVSDPAIIVGRSAAAPPISWPACRELGLSVHRRSSGGGVVLWDADLVAVDIVLPAGHPLLADDVVEAYRWVGEALVEALRSLGLDVHIVDLAAARAAPRDSLAAAACFGSISPWEAVAEGRKVVGLSQVRRREGGIIQVGVPLRIDLDRLTRVIDGPKKPLAERLRGAMVGTAELDPSVARAEVIRAMSAALDERLGRSARPGALTATEAAAERELASTRHAALEEPR